MLKKSTPDGYFYDPDLDFVLVFLLLRETFEKSIFSFSKNNPRRADAIIFFLS